MITNMHDIVILILQNLVGLLIPSILFIIAYKVEKYRLMHSIEDCMHLSNKLTTIMTLAKKGLLKRKGEKKHV